MLRSERSVCRSPRLTCFVLVSCGEQSLSYRLTRLAAMSRNVAYEAITDIRAESSMFGLLGPVDDKNVWIDWKAFATCGIPPSFLWTTAFSIPINASNNINSPITSNQLKIIDGKLYVRLVLVYEKFVEALGTVDLSLPEHEPAKWFFDLINEWALRHNEIIYVRADTVRFIHKFDSLNSNR